ncbi:MAG TPA: wax ester/triacylglycerol synthase family O-acyltransferase, partial [Nocardioidaceae bacterium]|nr:wax ester/triacylglycerol synthase family O-acyltransferase [Nocardioidaceae bacterium]
LDDAMFLLGESAGKPAHVIALQLFKPPADGGDDFTTQMYADLLAMDDVKPVFRKAPRRKLTSPSTLEWVDDGLDTDYHVRHAALPRPARVRELLETVSLQHGVMLDRRRPLWESHLYEGLQDGRFATTFKTHHALADGISLAGHVLGGLSPDPSSRSCTPPWVTPLTGAETPARSTTRLPAEHRSRDLLAPAKLGYSTVRTLREMSNDVHARLPFEAPSSIFNVGIGGARRFAGDQWDYARLKAIATATHCSVNDIVLTVCGAALRSFLVELDALPDRPLIAMVPVSLRRPDAVFASGEGNAFGSILCDLGTDQGDPMARLESIHQQMSIGKKRLSELSPREVLAVSRLIMGGAVLSALGLGGTPRQPFNLIISNVPASQHPLYYNGAEMTDIYPISMISEGQAVNITVTRYADKITFGIVGDRKAVPHLQRMLIHLENAITDLEKATA